MGWYTFCPAEVGLVTVSALSLPVELDLPEDVDMLSLVFFIACVSYRVAKTRVSTSRSVGSKELATPPLRLGPENALHLTHRTFFGVWTLMEQWHLMKEDEQSSFNIKSIVFSDLWTIWAGHFFE